MLFPAIGLTVASLQHHNYGAFCRSLHWTGGKVGAVPATFLIHTSGSSHTERTDPVVVWVQAVIGLHTSAVGQTVRTMTEITLGTRPSGAGSCGALPSTSASASAVAKPYTVWMRVVIVGVVAVGIGQTLSIFDAFVLSRVAVGHRVGARVIVTAGSSCTEPSTVSMLTISSSHTSRMNPVIIRVQTV